MSDLLAFENYVKSNQDYYFGLENIRKEHDLKVWQAALAWERSEYREDELRKQLHDLFNEVQLLTVTLAYYANTEIYRRPDRDRNGMGGMSAMTDFEIDDGEWKLDQHGEKDHYCYGKLARTVLSELENI